MRSKEIMDAVERGQAFTVTRDGHRIGELVPLRQRRRFVSRAEFAAMSRAAAAIDADAVYVHQAPFTMLVVLRSQSRLRLEGGHVHSAGHPRI
jgi:antitoxin (DNA-binding transcriptional repressor) of toxin-antitoxin stability system